VTAVTDSEHRGMNTHGRSDAIPQRECDPLSLILSVGFSVPHENQTAPLPVLEGAVLHDIRVPIKATQVILLMASKLLRVTLTGTVKLKQGLAVYDPRHYGQCSGSPGSK
jgi:hypothetical protein